LCFLKDFNTGCSRNWEVS